MKVQASAVGKLVRVALRSRTADLAVGEHLGVSPGRAGADTLKSTCARLIHTESMGDAVIIEYPAFQGISGEFRDRLSRREIRKVWLGRDSNPRPRHYECHALTS